MRSKLISTILFSVISLPLCVQASEKVDMQSYRSIGESIASGKQDLVTSYAQNGGAAKFKGEGGSNEVSVSEAIGFKGTDIKEKSYNAGNIYEAAREMASDPNNEQASVVKEGFLRGKEFEVNRSDNFLDLSRDAQNNPEKYIDFLSGKYSDCEVKSEEIMDRKEFSCDEYTVQQSHMCSVGRDIVVNAKHNYVCKKERKTFEKKCTKELKVGCESIVNCDASGIVKDSINIGNVQWQYNYPRITLGTINIFANPHNCEKRTAVVKFTIKNKDLIDVFKIIHADYSDWLRITVNGTQLVNTMGGTDSFFIEDSAYNEYQKRKEQKEKEIERRKQSHGVVSDILLNQLKNINSLIKTRENQGSAQGTFGNEHDFVRSGAARTRCNTKRFYNLPLNVDIRPYLKEGENEMVVELVFGNRGQLHLYMDTQQHCCDKWSEEKWEEKCEVVQ